MMQLRYLRKGLKFVNFDANAKIVNYLLYFCISDCCYYLLPYFMLGLCLCSLRR